MLDDVISGEGSSPAPFSESDCAVFYRFVAEVQGEEGGDAGASPPLHHQLPLARESILGAGSKVRMSMSMRVGSRDQGWSVRGEGEVAG